MNLPLLPSRLASNLRFLCCHVWLRTAAFCGAALVPAVTMQAQSDTFAVLPAGGRTVFGSFVQAPDGNLYAPTVNPAQQSLITQLAPDGTAADIYTFSALDSNGNNADGSSPTGLLVGNDGALYGATTQGGGNGRGTVFRLTTAGQFKVLATFAASSTTPIGPLVQDSAGNLYGCTGGAGNLSDGTVFQVTPAGQLILVHAFSQIIPTTGTNSDGSNPSSSLAIDSAGTIYGTTSLGGANAGGTIFEVAGGQFSVSYNFTLGSVTPGVNAASGELAAGAGGVFAAGADGTNITGVIFPLIGIPEALYTFGPPTENGTVNTGGVGPSGGLTYGSDGNLYGAAYLGGANGTGTLYQVTTDGGFTLLHTFGPNEYVSYPPLLAADGNLYGAAYLTGSDGSQGYSFYRVASSVVPSISSATVLQTKAGTPFNYQIIATNGPTSYSADGLPDGLSLASKTGLITGVLGAGTYTFDVGARNAEGSGYATITVTVAPASPNAPVISVPSTPLTTQAGELFTYQIHATKSPSDYLASPLPKGLTVDPKTGLIHGLFQHFGDYIIELEAHNASGTGSATLEVDVAPSTLPVAKVVGDSPNANAATGKVGGFHVTLSAVSGADLKVAYTVKGDATPGVDYKPLTGTIKIKAGKRNKTIKVVPKAGAAGTATKLVKITLQPGIGYTVGTAAPVEVRIVDVQ